ncbi:L,D-transpeptidase family protein [Streptomyces sp. NPDC002580]|uniref:L,D-transpeptidase family protein n=1 Tax=Streptomyces sp. NPDC002580 TaxID=3364653 RepID=UPI0036A3B13E
MMIRRRVSRGIAVLLTVAAAMPLGTAVAAPVPPVPVAGPVGEQVSRAMRGPYPSWWGESPVPMPVPGAETSTAGQGARDPRGTSAGTSGSPAPAPSAPGGYPPFGGADVRPARACDERTGPYQRQVERWLRLKEDGKQSASDCEAIRAFQAKQGIRPTSGFAGPLTWARVRLLSARSAPDTTNVPTTGTGCPARSYRVACVDLTRRVTWVQQGGRILFGPVPMRSGGVGHRTRTGWFKIYLKHRQHWSTLYNTPMPYAQFFSRGQAFHAVRDSIRTTGGSMGCVNLRLADARGLWNVLRTGDRVYVWGRRSGT